MNLQKLDAFKDDRGWLMEFVKSSSVGNLSQVYVINFRKPHIMRGGHYHKLKKEWAICLFGRCEVKLRDMKTGKRESYLLTEPYERLCISPYVYHTFECKGESQCIVVVVASDKEFREEKPDTYHELKKET